MKQHLHKLGEMLENTLTGVSETMEAAQKSVDEEKKKLSPKEREVIKFFEKEVMKYAVEGDVKQVGRVLNKMNQRLKEVQDADNSK